MIGNRRVLVAVTAPVSFTLLGSRLQALVDRGFDVHVVSGFALGPYASAIPSAATSHVIPMTRAISPIADLVSLWRFRKLIKRVRPHLVMGATPKASLVAILAARLERVPIRVWEVWGARWEVLSGLNRLLLARIDKVVAQCSNRTVAASHSLADLMVAQGVTSVRPTVLGLGSTHGVDLRTYRPKALETDHQRRLTLGFVGRITKDKGFTDLVRIAERVRSEFVDVSLLIVGDVDETDPPPPALMEWVRSQPWIRITGWVSSSAEYWGQIDILVFPSIREGLPNVVLEASASAVPVIAYAATGTRDAVAHEATGLLSEVGDLAGLQAGVLKLIEDSELRKDMGLRGRQFMLSNFEQDAVCRNYTRYFEEALAHLRVS